MAEPNIPFSDPLLNLDTMVERPVIKIDGELYEIRHPNELSVLEQARFGRAGSRIDELALRDSTPEVDEELEALIGQTARKIAVGVPPEVWDKLSGSHKWAILDLFTGLSLRKTMTVVGGMMKAAGDLDGIVRQAIGSTGEKSSPGLSDSTEARQSTGSKSTQSHS